MDIWKGSFAPMQKHRLYTGDISNHLYVSSIEIIDVESDLPDRVSSEIDPESIEELGEGTFTFLVTTSWVGGGAAYYFVVSSDSSELPTDKALELVQAYYESKGTNE